jgi:putative copper resistance protein D
LILDALSAIARALLYCGVLSCAGTVFATRTLLTPQLAPELEQRVAQITRGSAWLAIAASIAGVFILLLRLGGQFDESTLSAVFNSGFGAATALLLTGAGVLLASLTDPTGRTMRLGSAVLMTLSFALSGHAAAIDLADGLVVFVHASAAAWWIGSLLLLNVTCNKSELKVVAQVVRRFSAFAVALVGGLVIAGLILLSVLLNFANALPLTAYEQVLAIKIVIATVVVGVAAYNKFQLTPRLAAGDSTAVSILRVSINMELSLIAAVLMATAILTTYTSPPE